MLASSEQGELARAVLIIKVARWPAGIFQAPATFVQIKNSEKPHNQIIERSGFINRLDRILLNLLIQ